MDVVTAYKPQRWRMTLYRGMSWPKYSFTINDASNNPRDLTNATILMQVKVAEDDTVAVKTLTQISGFVISGTGHNTVTFDSLVDMVPGDYVADIIITYQSGEKKTYFRVEITVNQNVSRQ
jgi:endoglucanase Acf2